MYYGFIVRKIRQPEVAGSFVSGFPCTESALLLRMLGSLGNRFLGPSLIKELRIYDACATLPITLRKFAALQTSFAAIKYYVLFVPLLPAI